MKAGPSGSGKYHIQSEINMVPLIDVALVLLIIFMVISPMIVESQVKVNLPTVTTAASAEDTALRVEVDRDGALGFQGQKYTRDGLRAALTKALPPGNRASVLIQADRDVAFNNVVYVMDLAKQLNVQKLGVSVVPENQK